MIIEYTDISGKENQKLTVNLHDNEGVKNFINFLGKSDTAPIITKKSYVMFTAEFGNKTKAISTLKLNECEKFTIDGNWNNILYDKISCGIYARTVNGKQAAEFIGNLTDEVIPSNKALCNILITLNWGKNNGAMQEHYQKFNKVFEKYPDLDITLYKLGDIDKNLGWFIEDIDNIIL